jgi:nucleotide-binding universal stress UspA family protein
MSFKRLFVHFDNSERSTRALDMALQLADQHDAHLIGCGVESYPAVPGFVGAQVPAEIYETIAQEVRDRLTESRDAFSEACRKAGREDRCEWQQVEGDPAHALAVAARCTDLIVLGQSEPEKDAAHIQVLPDDLVMQAGHPILVVPYIGVPETIGRHILIGWTNTRESARAVMDALPLLQNAGSVDVVTVKPREKDSVPGADIARWLAAHGVKVTVKQFNSDIEPGDAMLNHVADTGADMIVMGAYGHSRLRETVLGGTTRKILHEMTVPVLMAH